MYKNIKECSVKSGEVLAVFTPVFEDLMKQGHSLQFGRGICAQLHCALGLVEYGLENAIRNIFVPDVLEMRMGQKCYCW